MTVRPPSETGRRDFVEALARGLEVLTAFGPTSMAMTVSGIATATGLARPTVRRLLLTLEELGYVHSFDGVYSLTTRVLEIGTSVIAAEGLWDVARPHMADLVSKTGESTSMAQLDGADIVYTARVPVPKIIAVAVSIGTRFPAAATSLGRVLLADLDPASVHEALGRPSGSGIVPRRRLEGAELAEDLAEIRARGWALSDELLSIGIRSVAVPVRDVSGRTRAAMNVTVHAADTSIEVLTGSYLPLLLDAAEAIRIEWAHLSRTPTAEVLPV